ncbi:hypothetical protein AAFF_G00317330 [Aldrovandia affinis]|uniref:Uncharacterized protein n=1 Tax=Aldrovandia affinis TaxID=143900 RepID=A0AAD7R7C2_9TELE|nr:hypothetical protein AAFF_G00317330 [Aldrovandia affinis]
MTPALLSCGFHGCGASHLHAVFPSRFPLGIQPRRCEPGGVCAFELRPPPPTGRSPCRGPVTLPSRTEAPGSNQRHAPTPDGRVATGRPAVWTRGTGVVRGCSARLWCAVRLW